MPPDGLSWSPLYELMKSRDVALGMVGSSTLILMQRFRRFIESRRG